MGSIGDLLTWVGNSLVLFGMSARFAQYSQWSGYESGDPKTWDVSTSSDSDAVPKLVKAVQYITARGVSTGGPVRLCQAVGWPAARGDSQQREPDPAQVRDRGHGARHRRDHNSRGRQHVLQKRNPREETSGYYGFDVYPDGVEVFRNLEQNNGLLMFSVDAATGALSAATNDRL